MKYFCCLNWNLRLGEISLYPKAPSEVRDPYRILQILVLEEDTDFRGSDMDATHSILERWGCHVRMNGGCLTLVGRGKYLLLDPVKVTVIPTAYNQTKRNLRGGVVAGISDNRDTRCFIMECQLLFNPLYSILFNPYFIKHKHTINTIFLFKCTICTM